MNLYDKHRHMYSDTIDNTKIYAEDVNSWIHKSELLYEIRIGIALWAFLTFGEEERTQRRVKWESAPRCVGGKVCTI